MVAKPAPDLLVRISQELDLVLTTVYDLAGITMPSFQPYLRARYGLDAAATAAVQDYINRLAAGYGAGRGGPHEGADEQPEQR